MIIPFIEYNRYEYDPNEEEEKNNRNIHSLSKHLASTLKYCVADVNFILSFVSRGFIDYSMLIELNVQVLLVLESRLHNHCTNNLYFSLNLRLVYRNFPLLRCLFAFEAFALEVYMCMVARHTISTNDLVQIIDGTADLSLSLSLSVKQLIPACMQQQRKK